LLTARLTLPWIGPESRAEAMWVGVQWLFQTLAFEFLAGHYLFGNSWEKLFADYNTNLL
jgi:hypothetical protein